MAIIVYQESRPRILIDIGHTISGEKLKRSRQNVYNLCMVMEMGLREKERREREEKLKEKN